MSAEVLVHYLNGFMPHGINIENYVIHPGQLCEILRNYFILMVTIRTYGLVSSDTREYQNHLRNFVQNFDG